MRANNRIHSSAALQTHGIWHSAIGYDPYAPIKEDHEDASRMVPNTAENAYANFQGLLALAKLSNSTVGVDRGACIRYGCVGHLRFQCKNFVRVKDDDDDEKDVAEATRVSALVVSDELKRSTVEISDDESDGEDDNEISSDSEANSEIERIIAERYGKKVSGKGVSCRKRKDCDEDGSDRRKKKVRYSKKRLGKKREHSDSDDSERRTRRRRRDHTNHDSKYMRRKIRKEKKRGRH